MKFSDPFRVQKKVIKFSPDGNFVAYAFHNTVYIREVTTGKLVASFLAMDVAQDIEWSPDSSFILCGLYERGIVQVASVYFPKWKCKIKECDVGIKKAVWCPDSRHIITVSNLHLWACVWSLCSSNSQCIYYLKASVDPVFEFSSNGKWLAVIEMQGKEDCISVFSSSTWHQLKSIPSQLDITGGLRWSPDSDNLCMWDKRINICRVQIMSISTDAIYKYEDSGLGIRTLEWSPSGQFLVLGCYDGKIRVLNHITWSQLTILTHCDTIESPMCTVFQENFVNAKPIFHNLQERPVTISKLYGDEQHTRNTGVSLVSLSSCGMLLATCDDSMPATVWIWNMEKFLLHTLLSFNGPLVDVAWDPVTLRMAAVSQSANVCLWAPDSGASVIEVPPTEFQEVQSIGLQWHPEGHTLALNTGGTMRLLWFPECTEFT